MTRVIHTGDTHLGYHQYNSPVRRDDFQRAFDTVVADAIADDVDAVVHAGDLFHDRRPGLADLQATVGTLRELADAEIPFLAVVGNHEVTRETQWLDLFADLGLATRLGSEPVVIGETALYGLDYVPQSRRPDLEYDFDPVPDAAEFATLVSHGLFEPFAHADWDTAEVLAAASVDFDVLLLGDNHAPDTAQVADTWVTYCGSTERASASERDPRGYNLVRFEESVSISRRAIESTREFVFVDLELDDDAGVETVHERIREHDVDDAVVVVTLEGTGDPVTPAAIEEFATERGALIARVNDRRDLPDEDEALSVQFADPDAAVRERLRELGLSEAARDIDRTVRNDDLADANVREVVERRVRETMDDDPSAFEPVEAGPDSAESDTEPDGDDESTEGGDRDDVSSTGGDGALTTNEEDPSAEVESSAETAEDSTEVSAESTTDSTAESDDPSDEPPEDSEEESTDSSEDEPEDSADADSATDRETTHASLGDFT